ncbi:MAG: 4-alpha-glucanotransferase [Bacillota bacterium]|nr:4-alpha-glucanotransferase [Bacillota bacterium]
MIKCCHDSQNKIYRTPVGALKENETVALCIRAEGDAFNSDRAETLSCKVHLWQTLKGGRHIPMEKTILEDGACLFNVTFTPSEEADLCWYYFILEDGTNTYYYGNNAERLGGEGAVYDYEPPAFQITVYKDAPVPKWYKDAIVYQIFPDRFARDEDWMEKQAAVEAFRREIKRETIGSVDNNIEVPEWKGAKRIIEEDWYGTPYYVKNEKGEVTSWPFFGGTLEGIRQKLFYLKSMGASAIYLNPIFLASSNHKYDTADYMMIDPGFGTEKDFRALCDDARKLGIRVILDGVFNHTGADSKYFDQFGNFGGGACSGTDSSGACGGPDSPYYKWYRFEEFPDKYDCWWGVGDLPNVEENEPSYREFIYGGDDNVVAKWLRAGASGWRLDVADELPDDFIEGIRTTVKETDPDAVLIGEVWEDASNKVSYDVQRRYFMGDELDSTMNYPVRDIFMDYMLGKSDAGMAVRRLNSLAENYPPENFYGALNLMGSHDRARSLTVLSDAPRTFEDKKNYKIPDDKMWLAKNRMKVLSLIQYVMPGVPCLYYGDEAGVQGYEDPYNRATYPWGREDEELMIHYRMLAQLRKQYGVLVDGDYKFTEQGEHIFICERFHDTSDKRSDSITSDETIILVANRHIFGSVTATVELPEGTEYVLELLSGEEVTGETVSGEAVELATANQKLRRISAELPPVSAKLYYCSKKKPQKLEMSRSAGVLCHVSSLPSGSLDGAEAFIDDLAAMGQKLWQILPLSPADEDTDSPYSGAAVFAGNTKLVGKRAAGEYIDKNDYERFCERESYWLDDYALYTVIKRSLGGVPWQQWPEDERDRKNLDKWRMTRRDELEVIKKNQYIFDRRWKEVKAYASSKGISVIGDIPIYAAVDSADTWAHRDVFLLGEDGYPLVGAGVPPDYFSEDGQHWGNPLYDWDSLKANDYEWWVNRVQRAMSQYDYIRLDHFRGFAAFFAIPRGGKPRDGWWLPGVGKVFFDFLESRLGRMPFLAEDLGTLDNQVHDLLKLTGCPGMLVYQFSVDEIKGLDDGTAATKILYSGTHDNQTLAGWIEENNIEAEPDKIIAELYESKSPWVILPLQDILGLGDESRMNIPGLAEGNWQWRAPEGWMTSELCEKMKELAAHNGR